MPTVAIVTDVGRVISRGATGCQENDVEVVIASCADDLTWIAMFASRGWKITVLEKCPEGRHKERSASGRGWHAAVGGPQRLTVTPNVGREAHSYLWHITRRYDTLPSHTVFLQGDALRHIPDIKHEVENQNSTLNRAVRECWSFASLVQSFHAATFRIRTYTPMSTFCALWRSFEVDAPQNETRCPLWSSAAHASFVVSRETIRAHSVTKYERWMRAFEDDVEARRLWRPLPIAADVKSCCDPLAPRLGATFFERAWTLIFGCAAALRGCAYDNQDTWRSLQLRCPMMNGVANVQENNTKPHNARLFQLVNNEVSPHGCIARHAF